MRIKDVKILTQVEDILFFNYGQMQKPISAVKYDCKTPKD